MDWRDWRFWARLLWAQLQQPETWQAFGRRLRSRAYWTNPRFLLVLGISVLVIGPLLDYVGIPRGFWRGFLLSGPLGILLAYRLFPLGTFDEDLGE